MGSTSVFLLFLLSYPALHVESRQVDGQTEYRIQPMLTPEELYVLLTVDRNRRQASQAIISDEDDMRFERENWINGGMSLLKTHNLMTKASMESEVKEKFMGAMDFTRKADLSRSTVTLKGSSKEYRLLGLPCQKEVWTGCPVIDARFSQFELDQ